MTVQGSLVLLFSGKLLSRMLEQERTGQYRMTKAAGDDAEVVTVLGKNTECLEVRSRTQTLIFFYNLYHVHILHLL